MKRTTCQEAQAHLLDYVEGELDEALRAMLREHLAACPNCRPELQKLERLRSALGRERVPDPGPEFWERFPDRVLSAYRSELSRATRADHVAQWWATLGPRLRLNVALLAVFALGLGASGSLSYELLQRNAREEIAHQAGLILEATVAMRGYTSGQIRPLLEDDADKFHPQTVPAYAATEMMTQVQKKYAGYSYKDAVLNPMNPKNRAVEWEEQIVGRFRGDPGEHEIRGVRDAAEGPLFYVARPSRVVSKACLACHTSPEVAPPAVVRAYGRTNGYGWKYEEIVGAQIVSVPMALPIRNADRAFLAFMASMTAVFAAVFIVLNIMMGSMIVRPDRSSD